MAATLVVAVLGAVCVVAADAPAAAQSPGESTASARKAEILRDTETVGTCVGIRGNGPRLFAHFGALARLAESTGPIRCAAGGSSGSITAFLLESTAANPLLEDCDGRPCTPAEAGQRQALMFRTMGGLLEVGVFGEIRQLIALVDAINAAGVPGLLGAGIFAVLGVALLTGILDQAGSLISSELGRAVRTSPEPVATALDIVAGLGRAVTFQPVDAASFIRPGPIDFAELGELIGRAGGFYAGYAPLDLDGQRSWLDDCAPATVGLTFAETKSVVAGASSVSCGERFLDLYATYRDAAVAAPSAPSRLDDTIGRYAPVLASTGVLTGEAIGGFDAARAQYARADFPVDFAPDFADVGFGVFGSADDLAKVDAGIGAFDDLGAQKTVTLYPASWREILASSPAEPGLSSGVPLSNGMVSVGGWADPLRVQVAETLGAAPVIALNKRDGLGAFTVSIASALGATPEQLEALYGLSVQDSNFQLQLGDATAVLCSDWDTPALLDAPALFRDGFVAPLLTDDPALLAAVPTASATTRLVGCSPELTTPPPTAQVAAVPTAGLTASFDASGSLPGFGTVLQYRWDFGDGTVSTTSTPTTTHRYDRAGGYDATVAVTNSNGSFARSAPVAVTVQPQRVDLRFSGLGYRVVGVDLDGAIATGPVESRDRITGGGTFSGRRGTIATVTVDLTRNALFDRWSGTIVVDDPGADFTQTTQVNLAPLTRVAGGVRLSANWFRPGSFLPTIYTLSFAVR